MNYIGGARPRGEAFAETHWRYRLMSVVGWFRGLFVKKSVARRKRVSRGKDVEEAGQWYFKRDILDQLDEYMTCIKRMKKTDKDGYRMYSRLGAVISSPRSLLSPQLGARWRVEGPRPGFGAIAFLRGDNEDEHWLSMKFGYFKKLDKPPREVEPTNGTVYEVTTFHTRADDPSKWSRASMCCYVSVDESGEVRTLRYAAMRKQTIHHKDGTARRGTGKTSTITHPYMTYGPLLENSEHRVEISPEERGVELFAVIATGYQQAASALRVSASKNGVTAVFGVDLLRTPYFFDERDATYTDSGNKKKIFHIVRTHKRTLKTGKETFVKSHFRGERRFMWNGYDVVVSMPGKHHKDLLGCDIGSQIYAEDEELPGGHISEKKMAKILSNHLQGGG